MMLEREILKNVMVKASQIGLRLFRNNTGTGWTGKRLPVTKATQVAVAPGDVVLYQARPLRAGLCEGSPDLVGWRPVKITEEMVGRTLAVFVGWELKTERGRATDAQKNFISRIEQDGGDGILTYGMDGAEEVLKQWQRHQS